MFLFYYTQAWIVKHTAADGSFGSADETALDRQACIYYDDIIENCTNARHFLPVQQQRPKERN